MSKTKMTPNKTPFTKYASAALITAFALLYLFNSNPQSDLAQQSTDRIKAPLLLESYTLHGGVLGSRNEPVLFKLITEDISMERIQEQAPLDLTCVIDVSGSMSGEKMALVKDSLKILLEYLRPQDKLTLISFSSSAHLQAVHLLTVCRLIEEFTVGGDKSEIIGIIESLEAGGGTNIPSGMGIALGRLSRMERSRFVFGVFLLSDGQNNYGSIESIRERIASSTFSNDFVINTYGFGNDHDPQQMASIANYRQGSFGFIEQLNKVDEYFISAIASLTTIQYSEVDITIELSQGLLFKKAYGGNIQILTPKSASIKLKNLISGVHRDFLFELGANKAEDTSQLFMDVGIQALNQDNVWERDQFRVSLKYDEKESLEFVNEKVESQWIRLNGTELLEQAVRLADQAQFDQCQEVLKAFIQTYKHKMDGELSLLKKSLENAQENCSPYQYKAYGKAQMTQSIQSNYQQDNIEAMMMEDVAGAPEMASNENSYQKEMIQRRKAQKKNP